MLRAARRRRRLSLTSLIDVIFLLLLFFMLTSTFSRFAEVELAAAAPAGGAADAPPMFLRLAPEDLSLNGEVLALDALPGALSDAGASDESARTLLISTTDGVTAQRLTDVLGALRGVAGVAPIVLGGS